MAITVRSGRAPPARSTTSEIASHVERRTGLGPGSDGARTTRGADTEDVESPLEGPIRTTSRCCPFSPRSCLRPSPALGAARQSGPRAALGGLPQAAPDDGGRRTGGVPPRPWRGAHRRGGRQRGPPRARPGEMLSERRRDRPRTPHNRRRSISVLVTRADDRHGCLAAERIHRVHRDTVGTS